MLNSRIWVAGQHGMVGKSVYEHLQAAGCDLIYSDRRVPDLTNQAETKEWYRSMTPDVVVMCAGRVGGIVGNSNKPVEFILDNVQMACNVIGGAHETGVKKLLYLGSSCIYPREAPQPMKPEHLLSSALEKTNEGYALAKIVGVRLCQYYRRQYGDNFIAAMPCNLYGPGDRYHPTDSHVIPDLIQKFHYAVQGKKPFVECLGDGSPRREFLYVDDLACACAKLLTDYSSAEIVNVGSGEEVTIKELVSRVAATVGYENEIRWTGTANGTPRKLLDSSVMRGLGWQPKVSLSMGLQLAYQDFVKRSEKLVDVADEEMPRWLRYDASQKG